MMRTEPRRGQIFVILLAISIVLLPGLFGVCSLIFDNKPVLPPKCDVTISVGPIEDNPPERLLIGGKRWRLVPTNFRVLGKPQDGQTDCENRVIWYDFSESPAEDKRDTLWHEIGHAIRCDHPKSEIHIPNTYINTSIEHQRVYELGMGLTSFVHDNPEFMDWAMHWKEK